MWYLFEGLWYAFLVFIQIIWIPALILLAIGLIAKILGKVVRYTKKK